MAYRKREDILKYHRELYHWCVEHGICARCRTAYAEPGRVYCKSCARRDKAMSERRDPGGEARRACCRERRARLKAAGLCVGCGKRPPVEGQTRCAVCARKKRESDQVGRIRRRIAAQGGERK